MKTTRRQELRTNDLSYQIEQIGDYLKRNATAITVIVVALVALALAGIWYYNRRTTRLMDAYAELVRVDPNEQPVDQIRRYKSVASEQIDPTLTTTAWLDAGNLALSQLAAPKTKAPDDSAGAGEAKSSETADQNELAKTAEEAFTKVLSAAKDNPAARGRAMMGMGVLEEDRRHFDKARQWYKKVIDDPQLANLPFRSEAQFRLEGLNAWSEPVEFPPPPPMVMLSFKGQPVGPGDLTTPETITRPTTRSVPSGSAAQPPPTSQPAGASSPTQSGAAQPPPPTTQPAAGR